VVRGQITLDTITVSDDSTGIDLGGRPSGGPCNLPSAIQLANDTPGPDTTIVPNITLPSPLTITDPVTLTSTAAPVQLDAPAGALIFRIPAPGGGQVITADAGATGIDIQASSGATFTFTGLDISTTGPGDGSALYSLHWAWSPRRDRGISYRKSGSIEFPHANPA
jgi:hypothetical protein